MNIKCLESSQKKSTKHLYQTLKLQENLHIIEPIRTVKKEKLQKIVT